MNENANILAIAISSARTLACIFLLDLACLVFLAMKASGVMPWSWWYILIPLGLSCLNTWSLNKTVKILVGAAE